jgi:hypothetical protein
MLTDKDKDLLLAEIADSAITVQDACNTIAVANHFHRDAAKLTEILGDSGELLKHPAVILVSDKLVDMLQIRERPTIDQPLDETTTLAAETQKLVNAFTIYKNDYRVKHNSTVPTDDWRSVEPVLDQVCRIARLCGSQIGALTFSKAQDQCYEIMKKIT